MEKVELSIKISNKKPIELNELTNSLNAFSREYDLFCKDSLGYEKNQRKLEIVKLEKGSLCVVLTSIIPVLIENQDSIYYFGKYFVEALKYFISKKKKPPQTYSKNNCDNLSNFLNQTANDNNSNLDIKIVGNNNNIQPITLIVTHKEGIEARNNIAEYKHQLLQSEPLIKYKQTFYWASASFIKNKQDEFADKGIIESLDSKPYKIIFEDDKDRKNIIQKKKWQDLIYLVDVEVILVQGEVTIYKILKVYEEEFFKEKLSEFF